MSADPHVTGRRVWETRNAVKAIATHLGLNLDDDGKLVTPEPTDPAPKTFSLDGTWLVQDAGEHTCGGEFGWHERGCGFEPIMDLAALPGYDALVDGHRSTGTKVTAEQAATMVDAFFTEQRTSDRDGRALVRACLTAALNAAGIETESRQIIRVWRACNGCGRELRPVTDEETTAAISGAPLPDVSGECAFCQAEHRDRRLSSSTLAFARECADPNFSLSIPDVAKGVIRDLLAEVNRLYETQEV
jgi:hypothetical protein